MTQHPTNEVIRRGSRTGVRTILVAAPHPDDAELGIGGTILTLLAAGHTVHMLDLTNGEPTPKGDPATRAKEAAAAAKILGVASRTTLDLPNRYLMDSIEARTKVAEVIRRIQPDLMLIPQWIDAHPDHVQASIICEAARFQAKYTKTQMAGSPWYAAKILYYMCSHLRLELPSKLIVDVSKHFDTKIRAARCYVSQFEHNGQYPVIDMVTTFGRYFGSLINAEYGEPILSREPIGVTDLRDII